MTRSAPPTGVTLVVLLPACAVLGLLGLRDALADYQLGADAQVHRVGTLMLAAAVSAGVAAAASAHRAHPALRRWVFALVAAAIVLTGLVWGPRASADARRTAHVCACEGG